jgi:NADH dehydrogenase [ubiquinone] 1 alpha subcomplex assembly factor 7
VIQAQTLKEILLARIARDGPMSIDTYMEAALTDPKFGYYINETPFGRGGDFITAPEVSQMFGELIGLWATQVWMNMGGPENISLVELGPGRGTLMADFLRTIGQIAPDFAKAAHLHLVEASPSLKAEQASQLNQWADHPISWHTAVSELAPGPMIVIANEFFDALPIKQFVKSHDGWHERLIADGIGGKGTLGFVLERTPLDDESTLPDATLKATVEAIAEIRPQAGETIKTLTEKTKECTSAILVIDYGYEKSAPGDTFQGVQNHLPQHVLAEPGKTDLTAHVDFEVLQSQGAQCGWLRTEVVTQAQFLRALGIEARFEVLLKTATEGQRVDITSAMDRLVSPQQMGSLFKALALYSEGQPKPPGFDTPATS